MQLFNANTTTPNANAIFMSSVVWNINVCLNLKAHSTLIAMNMLKSSKSIRFMRIGGTAKFAERKWVIIIQSRVFHLAATKVIITNCVCNNMLFQPDLLQNVHHVAKMQKNIRNSLGCVEFTVQKKTQVCMYVSQKGDRFTINSYGRNILYFCTRLYIALLEIIYYTFDYMNCS